MEYIGLNELREKFLAFFESKGHYRLPGFPLLPIDDESLLLINSGMAPMKNYFLGRATPPSKRVVTCQKCIRTPDIENVGKTSRHGTYFEMLGNFSFGDYFKKQACVWAWEFVINELKMPADKLYVSVYLEDDEAAQIWKDEVGVAADRIVRLGKADNFWEIGSGPCGPSSEIYYDRGEQNGCGKADCAPGCDCDRFVEFWNLVFSQFDGDGNGNYTLVEHPNIDTGMGLERIACIMQGVDNLFEVDTIRNILDHAAKIAGVEYKKDDRKDVSLRVITDHIRSTTFMLCDGIKPSNEGRGYVLKRLLRRAARHGRLLGVDRLFLFELAETVIKENENAYPELTSKTDYIVKSIKNEEQTFLKTIDNGMDMLNDYLNRSQAKNVSGEVAFKLYDTYGFPIDLTAEIAAEKGFEVDFDEFDKNMLAQRERARKARQDSDNIGWKEDAFDELTGKNSIFAGYEQEKSTCKILGIVKDSVLVDSAGAGDDVVIVLDYTPFYANSGGQVGDTGWLEFDNGRIEISDCKKDAVGHFLHFGKVIEGVIKKGQSGFAQICVQRRLDICRNHTAAHLLQAALRLVLGEHVHQAGSLVRPERLRYDFSHFSAMTDEQIKKVQSIVNDIILKGMTVENYETDIEDAKDATALFGEKYGDRVRVCNIPGFSKELCGGTHIDNTAKIGLFKILSESSVSSGVRRIEAVSGLGVIELINSQHDRIINAAKALKLANPTELEKKCAAVMEEIRDCRCQLNDIKNSMATSALDEILAKAKVYDEFKVIAMSANNIDTKSLRRIGDELKSREADVVAAIIAVSEGKGTILCVCGDNAVKAGLNAGKLASALAEVTCGKGGGRADFAMAGVGDTRQINKALGMIGEFIGNMLKK